MAIPVCKSNSSQYNIPGWSDYVNDKYDTSRQAFLDWVADGKPICGFFLLENVPIKASF